MAPDVQKDANITLDGSVQEAYTAFLVQVERIESTGIQPRLSKQPHPSSSARVC